MAHQVTIDNTGEVFCCTEDVHVLAAMEKACCHGIPVGCRNGGCGACKVRITSGSFHTRKMNRAVISAAEEADGCVLACKLYPQGDLTVKALGRVWGAGTVRKSASFSLDFTRPAVVSQPDKET
jgi:ferredoxin